jgi:diguanylate cyclase (GGDEF)-like protein
LEAAGFNVMTTAGAAASIVSVSRSRPHLVIVDAGLKGVALGDMVRAIDSLRLDAGWTIPVIVIGDEAATAERQLEAITSGAFDYCQVPANSSLLLARTAQLVALKQTTDRLYEETNKDYLTGLANRRRFRRRLGQELERWRRYKVPCALALVDIDHMKRINDTQGHPAGDIAIRHVGDALLEAAQDNNLAARLGGEEFALLLAGADEAKAVIAAENLRRIISSMPVENIGLITVSIGVSACPAHADSERKLYMAADSALYRAKEEGRNRTAVATQENHSQMEQVVLLE